MLFVNIAFSPLIILAIPSSLDTLIKIIYNEKIKNLPKILETPYVGKTDDDKERIYPPYKYEIEMIRNKKFDTSLLEKIRNNE